MKIIKTKKGVQKEIARLRRQGRSIGFVPTMGYFHEGHLSLMRQSVRENDVTVVSLFVNPTQFGPKEDLARYPRDLGRDSRMAREVGVDILFVPSIEEMYPEFEGTRDKGQGTGKACAFGRVPCPMSRVTVKVGPIGDVLCGASRPGHFDGVATVVVKLLNIVTPDVMYLGEKDAQQVVVLKKVVKDMDLPVRIRTCPIFREPDGLAMSSRNVYLSPTEREEAVVLSRALREAASRIRSGERDGQRIISEIKKLILEGAHASIDYVSVVDAVGLSPVRRISGNVLIALAARFGKTRLIDNITVKVHGQ
ncbi:MAG: pantoate--beta-alanine ligase [Elusimicrobia bacterium]|nr:pantoate--beta-alanine ligase [Elusimicrobiota bacterium]